GRREAAGRPRRVGRPGFGRMDGAVCGTGGRSVRHRCLRRAGIPAATVEEYLGFAHVLARHGGSAPPRPDAAYWQRTTAAVRLSNHRGCSGNAMAPITPSTMDPEERGAALVEFALALPLLLVVIAGIVDFGFTFQRYEIITNAAREGARMASLPGYDQTSVDDRVRAYVAAGLGVNTSAL